MRYTFVVLWMTLLFSNRSLAENLPEWAKDPMNTPASQLWAEVNPIAAEEGLGVAFLLQKVRVEVDDQQRATVETLSVYRLFDASRLEDLDDLMVAYPTWLEKRPEIAVRIINGPDQETRLDGHDLEPQKQYEGAEDDDDHLQLTLPLPQARAGSLIVTRVVRSELRPFFETGISRDLELEPYRWLDATLVLPNKAKAKFRVQYLQADPALVGAAHTTYRFSLHHPSWSDSAERDEDNHPGNSGLWPLLEFSTVATWNTLAKAYHAHAEALLAKGGLPTPPATAIDAKDPRATALNLSNWLNESIRTSQSPFDANGMLPDEPATVIQRGYGDAKDKALLLVGLLRKNGIKAHLALLATSAARPSPELPSLQNFDHALVFLPETKFWIDPSQVINASGVLPTADLEVPALIIEPRTQGLVRTPSSPSSESRYFVRSTTDLRTYGVMKESALMQFEGAIADQKRLALGTLSQSELDAVYGSIEGFVGATCSNGRDLETPMAATTFFEQALSLEAFGGLRALQTNAEVLLEEFESVFPDIKRDSPFHLVRPFQYTWENVVLLPPGFSLDEPIEDKTFTLGATVITRTHRLEPGRIIVTYSGDFLKTSLTPEEYTATVAALNGVDMTVTLSFHVKVEELMDSPDCIAAFQELHRLEQDPKTRVWALFQRAFVLADLGLVEEAWQTLFEPLAKESDNLPLAQAAVDLARVLRPTGKWSRGECATATHALIRGAKTQEQLNELLLDLAVTAETNHNGERYRFGSDLTAALELRQKLASDVQGTDLQELLVQLGKFEALEASLAPLKEEDRIVYRLAAAAGQNKLSALLKSEPGLVKTQALVVKACDSLLRAGYSGACLNLAESSKATPAVTIDRFKRLHALKTSFEKIAPGTPKGTLKRYFKAILDHDREAFEASILPQSLAVARAEFDKKFTKGLRAGHREVFIRVGKSLAPPMNDLELDPASNPQFGYRFTKQDDASATLYLASDKEGMQIVCEPKMTHVIGLRVLDLLKRNQDQGAFVWLDWAQEEPELDPLGESASATLPTCLWGKEVPRTRQTATIAAQFLAARGPGRQRVLADLQQAYRTATGNIRHVLAHAIIGSRNGLGADPAMIEELYRDLPNSVTVRDWFATYCLERRDFERLERELNKWGRNSAALMLNAAWNRGGWASAEQMLQALEKAGIARSETYTALIHFGLYEDQLPRGAAEAVSKLGEQLSPESHRAVAAILVEVGKFKTAVDTLFEDTDDLDWFPPPEDHYIRGRIAERLGEREIAISRYRMVPMTTKPFYESYYDLAQKRLKALGATP